MQVSMQRIVSMVLATMVASLLLVSLGTGVAWAVLNNVDCTIDPVALCVGGPNADFLEGEDMPGGGAGASAKDIIKGLGGGDGAEGNGGNDKIYGGDGWDGDLAGKGGLNGGDGNDYVFGGDGDDERIDGESGNDKVSGGPGDDGFGPTNDGDLEGGSGNNSVYGNDGDDQIDANDSLPGEVEFIFGGTNDDTIEAVDGEVDNIDCGTGNDTVIADLGIDVVAGNC
jgi:hypothetical protein